MIAAVSRVLLTYVVVRFGALPAHHRTAEKPVPLTVSVKAGPPGVARMD